MNLPVLNMSEDVLAHGSKILVDPEQTHIFSLSEQCNFLSVVQQHGSLPEAVANICGKACASHPVGTFVTVCEPAGDGRVKIGTFFIFCDTVNIVYWQVSTPAYIEYAFSGRVLANYVSIANKLEALFDDIEELKDERLQHADSYAFMMPISLIEQELPEAVTGIARIMKNSLEEINYIGDAHVLEDDAQLELVPVR